MLMTYTYLVLQALWVLASCRSRKPDTCKVKKPALSLLGRSSWLTGVKRNNLPGPRLLEGQDEEMTTRILFV
ncbi:hypothetical protein BDW67DRAFT_161852 [Aspergillus spinulosporus]